MLENILIGFKVSLVIFSPIALFLIILAVTRRDWNPIIAGFLIFVAARFDGLIRTILDFYIPDDLLAWKMGLISFIWPLVVVFAFKWLTAEEVGLTLHQPKESLRYGFLFGLILGGWNFVDEFLMGVLPHENLGERILFMITVPGLTEELLYRGLLLAIADRFLGTPWKYHNIPYGWGIILTSILFINGHLFSFSAADKSIIWIGSIDLVGNVIVATAAFAFLRIRTKSIWPGVICHGLIDAGPYIGAAIFALSERGKI